MDLDSSMLSSPSSHDETLGDDQDLFPESVSFNTIPEPQTPENDHLNAAAPGELSPPRSQSHTANPHITDDPTFEDNVLFARKSTRTDPTKTEDGKFKAGSWKTKKAQEEMAKAWDSMVDRDFTLKRYPDPMAHKIPSNDSGPGFATNSRQRGAQSSEGGVVTEKTMDQAGTDVGKIEKE